MKKYFKYILVSITVAIIGTIVFITDSEHPVSLGQAILQAIATSLVVTAGGVALYENREKIHAWNKTRKEENKTKNEAKLKQGKVYAPKAEPKKPFYKSMQTTNEIVDSVKSNYDIEKPKRVSKKQHIKDLKTTAKQNGIAYCPKCGSSSITTTNKKISAGKGVAGAAIGSLINPVGTVIGAGVGAISSKKLYCVCMSCGNRWKPGK